MCQNRHILFILTGYKPYGFFLTDAPLVMSMDYYFHNW